MKITEILKNTSYDASLFSEEAVLFVEQGIFEKTVRDLNTLDYSRWNEVTKQEEWNDTYNEGFKKLKKLQPKGSSDYSLFTFDLVMANPPFAGDIKENRGVIEVLYLLRCSLMHGEVSPDKNSAEVYRYAYEILAIVLKNLI